MIDVLEIAKTHRARQWATTPAGTCQVSEWRDEKNKPVELVIKRPSSADVADIILAKKRYGDVGVVIRTVIKCCYSSEAPEKRVFADTDEKALLEEVDHSVLESIYLRIVELLPDLVR